MSNCKPCSTPLCSNTKLSRFGGSLFSDVTLYRSTIGALQYLTNTRPDISFTANKLSQYLAASTETHWKACKRLLRYLKGIASFGLLFKPATEMHLAVYSDADWDSCVDDSKSTSGCCVFLDGNLINWSSKKQTVVAHSSTEAEYRALAQACAEVLWVQSLFSELGLTVPSCAIIWCDNTSAASLAHNTVFHARTKHREIDVHFIREKIASKQLIVQYVPTELQKADIFTKALP
ncbi:hypothetical protein ACOSQ4_004037 [Xanthoceras sorbifolium]